MLDLRLVNAHLISGARKMDGQAVIHPLLRLLSGVSGIARRTDRRSIDDSRGRRAARRTEGQTKKETDALETDTDSQKDIE